MLDLHEPRRQDVYKEAADKLLCCHGHYLQTGSILVVPPLETDHPVSDTQYPAIGDSNPVGIPAQVFDDTGGVPERWFAIYDPFFLIQTVQESTPSDGIVQITQLSQQAELRLFKIVQELAAKFPRKHLNRDKELFARFHPLPDSVNAAAGNDAVDMWMVHEILSPCMQDRGKTKHCTQILFIGGKLLQCLGDSTKQYVVNGSLILKSQCVECVGDREHNMEIAYIQEAVLLIIDPAFL